MSATNPAYSIPRQSIAGDEGEWAKHFDPPGVTPPTPEYLAPTNPVPEFMQSLGLSTVNIPHTVRRELLHRLDLVMWDGKSVLFYAFSDPDLHPPFGQNVGTYPAPTIRMPRGVIFHGFTGTHKSHHTIHWHGIEPTPINDGVGHCSMEIDSEIAGGGYTYQWQPNHIGTYFYHCHRNTMQHFEYGLFGMLFIEPPDAYDPGDGKNVGGYPRRTAANTARFPQFPGFNSNPIESGDPHAYTVPYDVEALWVLDDVDSVWREKMPGHTDTYPDFGTIPGVNDRFYKGDFHDFNPDYFFVTGLPFPGRVGSTASCEPNVVIPAALNSGVAGMQVSVSAQVNQTILVRILCAAYVSTWVSFPLDVVVIAYDGRALGVPPFGKYNRAFLLKAGTAIELSTARRFDVLMWSDTPVFSFASVEFRHNRNNAFLLNGQIPIVIE